MDQEQVLLEPEMADAAVRKGKLIKLVGLFAFLALLASAILFFWNRQSRVSEQEYLSRAQSFMAAAQLPAAAIELKNALRANPRNTRTRLSLSDIYLKLGMGAEAEEQLNRVRELGADGKVYALPLGEALLLRHKYDKVLQEIKPEAFLQATERLQAVRIRADALFGLGRQDEACPLFKQIHLANPKHVPTYWGMIKCAVARKDFPTARADMEAALKLEPHNLRSLILKGDLAQAMNDPASAEAAYGAAIAADPKSIAALLSRASIRLESGREELAVEDMQAAKNIAPNVLMVRYMEAFIAYRQGRFAEAQNIIQGVVGRSPDHQPSRLLSGFVAFQLGQYRLADKDLSAVLVWQPENRDARLMLAQSRLLTGQPEGALALLEPLLSGESVDAEAYSAAGDAYLRLGKSKKAAEFLAKAAALMPAEASMRSKIGLWRLQAGDISGAAKELESAATLGDLPLQTEALRITTMLMRKELDQALASALAMEKRFPDQAIVYNLQGMAYLARQKDSAARRSFERALAIQPTNIATVRSLAKMDMFRGKLAVAKARYESVLKHDPVNYEAMMDLSQLAKLQGHDDEYADWLARAAKAAPGETPPRLSLARHHLSKKEPMKALPWARQALDLNPRNIQTMEVIGDTQLANGENDNALYSYLQWTLVAPDSSLAYYKLGKAQATAGHAISARDSFERALKLKPDYAEAAIAAILLAQRNGWHQDAIRHAQRLQQYQPSNWEGFALEGDSHAAQGRYAEAVKPYGQAFSLHRSSRLFIHLYQALTRSEQLEKAQQIRTAWLRDAPKDLTSRLYLGYNHLLAGQAHEAQAEFQVAIGIDSASIPALVGMSAALDAQSDTRALKYAELAFQKSGRNAATSDLLGWMLFSRGETQRGLELLRRAESLDPDNATVRYHVAAALAKSGDTGMARHMLEVLLAKGGKFQALAEAQALLKSLPVAQQSKNKP
jgi:putative PEP-CTERM system TPR-repeat lipoprotein